jgi:putative ABC transport system permease protein
VSGICIAGDFWTVTGARPALGRLFGPEAQGAVVLSWDLFEHQFGGDPGIIGKAVSVDGNSYTVSGVLPGTFRFQFPMWWLASQPQPVEAYFPLPNQDVQRGRMVNVVAALKRGVGTGQALAEINVLEKHIRAARQGARNQTPPKLHVVPLQEKLVGDTRPALLVLLAAGVFVLLMAAVNVANLLLARATVRQREIAIRAAVGAGRMRVVRQFLAESVMLALAGGALGLLFARWAIEILVRISPHALPRLSETTIDGWVLAFTAGVSVGTGVLFGTGPALSLWRANLHDALKSGARTSTGLPGLRVRRALVAVELALAVVLLTGAGLMLKSLLRMNAHPAELAPERILVMKVRLSGAQYAAAASHEAYMRELVRRIQSAPGVEAAGISNWLLFEGLLLPGQTSPDQTQVIRLNFASPGYLRTMGMRLLEGRWLTDNEPAGAALVNQGVARQLFGDADPIGRRFNIPGQQIAVVGVVADLKYSKLDAEPPAEAFLPYQQFPMRGADVAVRTTGDPKAMAPAIRKLVSGIDPTQPVYAIKTLEQALAESVAPRRFNLVLLETFAAAALLLALVGVYGVIAYSVGERTREIGLRMALGAQGYQVVRMVVQEGAVIALAGIAAGLAAAFLLTRLMASLLYDVTATDPSTFAAATIALAVAAFAASWGPALKAASVDPMVTLRNE